MRRPKLGGRLRIARSDCSQRKSSLIKLRESSPTWESTTVKNNRMQSKSIVHFNHSLALFIPKYFSVPIYHPECQGPSLQIIQDQTSRTLVTLPFTACIRLGGCSIERSTHVSTPSEAQLLSHLHCPLPLLWFSQSFWMRGANHIIIHHSSLSFCAYEFWRWISFHSSVLDKFYNPMPSPWEIWVVRFPGYFWYLAALE